MCFCIKVRSGDMFQKINRLVIFFLMGISFSLLFHIVILGLTHPLTELTSSLISRFFFPFKKNFSFFIVRKYT